MAQQVTTKVSSDEGSSQCSAAGTIMCHELPKSVDVLEAELEAVREERAALQEEIDIMRKHKMQLQAQATKAWQYMEEFEKKQAETDRIVKQLQGKKKELRRAGLLSSCRANLGNPIS